jgi:hypothetical protein
MSYKKELEERKAAQNAAAQELSAQQQQAIARMTARAQELREHIEVEAEDLGLVIKQANARLQLSHPNSSNVITIDSDVDKYIIHVQTPQKGSDFLNVASKQTIVLSVDDVDKYLLDFLEQISAV